MGIFLNYLFIGFVLAFLLDYFSFKYQGHIAWQNVPKWGWGARIMFSLVWPVGVIIFIYLLIREFNK